MIFFTSLMLLAPGIFPKFWTIPSLISPTAPTITGTAKAFCVSRRTPKTVSVLFAMNFECKSTFKSKWKRFGSLALRYERNYRGNKTHVLLADEPTYAMRWNAFKWGLLPTVKTTVILLKNIFEFMFTRARLTLYGAPWRNWSFRGKAFNKLLSPLL